MTAILPKSTAHGSGTLLSVVLPAYNESSSLADLLDGLGHELGQHGIPHQIVVVDDGSSDGTDAVVKAAAEHWPVRLLTHARNEGLGRALRTGLLDVIPDSSVVVTMVASGVHDPALIPQLLEELDNGRDIVIGSRFHPGGARRATNRRWASRTASALIGQLAPLDGVRDYSSGFRAYRADLLKRLVDLYGEDAFIEERGFACMLEVLLKAGSQGATMGEVPLVLRRRSPRRRPRILEKVGRYGAVVRTHRPETAAREATPPDDGPPEWAHRALNVAVAVIGLILTAPLMACIAILIRVTSRGPVLYLQPRVGIERRSRPEGASGGLRRVDVGGRPFNIYKFRTMRPNGGSQQNQVWASPDDPRVTPVGRVLRKYRLDELPQLFNVLRGDMSIVGPRPEQPKIFAQLRQQIDRYPHRQRVPPGITGWAQINHHYDRSIDDVRRKVQYDLDYIQRRSLLEDLRIMWRTLPVIIFKKGAW